MGIGILVVFAFFNTNNGAINSILLGLNLIDTPTNILINTDIAWFFQLGVGILKSAGWSSGILRLEPGERIKIPR